MKKLTAAGQNWERVNDPFENLVDQAYEIVREYGVSRIQIENDMVQIKEQIEKPGCDTKRLSKVFLDGLRALLNEAFVPQDTTGKSTNGTPDG